MWVEEFNYVLPQKLIAQEPIPHRDESRLLVLHRKEGFLEHRCFRDLGTYLRPGDVMILNDSRVLPARIFARRAKTGGKVETLLLKSLGQNKWEALVKPGRRVPVGEELIYGEGELKGTVVAKTVAGGRVIEFNYREGTLGEHLGNLGQMPLPPYIHKELKDPERYQTVYSRREGSAAAPTAGLHFTREFLREIRDCGVEVHYLTLHVGLDTFRPLKVKKVEEHKMHTEYYEVPSQTAEAVNRCKRGGGRVIAVGTTVARTLETAVVAGSLLPGEGWSDLFIYPGYEFKMVDVLLTNFHLPQSTLLLLVSAFAGKEKILHAYGEAVKEEYRFFSFGDAMLII